MLNTLHSQLEQLGQLHLARRITGKEFISRVQKLLKTHQDQSQVKETHHEQNQ